MSRKVRILLAVAVLAGLTAGAAQALPSRGRAGRISDGPSGVIARAWEWIRTLLPVRPTGLIPYWEEEGSQMDPDG